MERITSCHDLRLAVAARPSVTRQLCCRQVPAVHQESFLAKRGSPITCQFRNIYPVGNPHSTPKKVNKCTFIYLFSYKKLDKDTNKNQPDMQRKESSACSPSCSRPAGPDLARICGRQEPLQCGLAARLPPCSGSVLKRHSLLKK